MRGLTVSDISTICGGILYGNGGFEYEVKGVAIDSRQISEGMMFAAMKGERVDGHDYIKRAFELGAVCCIAEHVPEGVTRPVIAVENVAEALKKLAEEYRKTLMLPIIGIAGSVGKTTAKEMVASVLSERYRVLKTEKNLNNELGVPLTLFRIDPEHEIAVVEMGISDFGEMRRLAKMVRPSMAVYTVIGHAHLEKLHDRAGVLRAKTEMLEYMAEDSTLFLNGDDNLLAAFECSQSTVIFGLGENADICAENICYPDMNTTECDIVYGERVFHAVIPAYGKHMVYAALEGASVGIEFGLTDDEIAAGIAKYETVGRRANVCETGFLTLIDDCYNANPDSVRCAIDSLSDCSGRRVCILGDMFELGERTHALHAEMGCYAAERGAELVLTCGELSRSTHSAAAELCEAKHFDTNAELIAALPELLKKGDCVLVKASHSMKFDEISEAIKKL